MGQKEQIINHIQQILDERIVSAKQAISSAKESRDNETKSSVGDKYETGRAMMQFELEKNQAQLNKTEKLKLEISKIDVQKESKKVEFGSFVSTSLGDYFISVGLGKIELNEKSVYCISLASPIGKILNGRLQHEEFEFQRKKVHINRIL